MKTRAQILFPVSVTFLLFACDANDITSGKQTLKEYSNICTQVRFDYDGGHLVGFTRSFGPRISTIGTCFYNGDQLVRVQTTSDNGVMEVIELEYEEGLLKKEILTVDVVSIEPKNHYVETASFEYDENGTLRSKIQTQDYSSLAIKTDYEWSNGNIVKLTYGTINEQGDFSPQGCKVLSYDKGRNYTNQDLAFVYANSLTMETVLSQNNLVSTSDDVFFDDQDIAIETTNDFTYNGFGYPIENKITSLFIIGSLVNKLTYE